MSDTFEDPLAEDLYQWFRHWGASPATAYHRAKVTAVALRKRFLIADRPRTLRSAK